MRKPADGKLERTTLRPRNANAEVVRGYRLLVIGENEHTARRLPSSGEVSIGRSESADIQVKDPLMSRIHAKLLIGPELYVADMGSSNGTVIRGERMPSKAKQMINVGDTIEIGSTVIIVQPEFSRATPPAHPATETTSAPSEADQDDAMKRVYKLARRIASSQINVLLLGETGVGKEVLARTIHSLSDRTGAPFLGLNCAALNEALFESELFGYEKGAFTGATQTSRASSRQRTRAPFFWTRLARCRCRRRRNCCGSWKPDKCCGWAA